MMNKRQVIYLNKIAGKLMSTGGGKTICKECRFSGFNKTMCGHVYEGPDRFSFMCPNGLLVLILDINNAFYTTKKG